MSEEETGYGRGDGWPHLLISLPSTKYLQGEGRGLESAARAVTSGDDTSARMSGKGEEPNCGAHTPHSTLRRVWSSLSHLFQWLVVPRHELETYMSIESSSSEPAHNREDSQKLCTR